MTRSRYLVGIDLGTTNCAVAYVDTHGRERPSADIRNFEVPQLVAPGETAPRAMLPSFLYLPGEHELPPARRGCPGTRGPTGSSASSPGSRGRRCPAGWSAAPRAGSVMPGSTARPTSCPGEARPRSRRSRRSRRRPLTCGTSATPGTTRSPRTTTSLRLENQEVVLTVPASFDEAARELTIEAAKRAELGDDHAARGAPGGVLLLDRLAPGPLAARGPGRRADPGLRHRRRHDRLQPDHGRRDADRARVSPRRRRRSPDARRRQHRPRAGPSRREEARRRRGSTPSSGVRCGSPAGRPRRSCWASSSRRSSAGRSRSPAEARS